MLSLQVNRWDYRLSLGSMIKCKTGQEVCASKDIDFRHIPHNHHWISSKDFLCKWRRRIKDNIRQYVDKRLKGTKEDLFNTYKLL